jgi:hypothetical protein
MTRAKSTSVGVLEEEDAGEGERQRHGRAEAYHLPRSGSATSAGRRSVSELFKGGAWKRERERERAECESRAHTF